MSTKTKMNLGLMKRHELPVDDFIIDGTEIENVLDFDAIGKKVTARLTELLPLKETAAIVPSYDGDVRVTVNSLQADVDIYITGLTAVTIAVLNWLAGVDLNGHSVRFMHYDRDSGSYVPQVYQATTTVPVSAV